MNFFEVWRRWSGILAKKACSIHLYKNHEVLWNIQSQTLREITDLTWIWSHTRTNSHHRWGVVYHEVDWHLSDHRVRGRNQVKSKWQPTQKETNGIPNKFRGCLFFLTRSRSLKSQDKSAFSNFIIKRTAKTIEKMETFGAAHEGEQAWWAEKQI